MKKVANKTKTNTRTALIFAYFLVIVLVVSCILFFKAPLTAKVISGWNKTNDTVINETIMNETFVEEENITEDTKEIFENETFIEEENITEEPDEIDEPEELPETPLGEGALGDCNCINCIDCMDQLNNVSCDVVKLTANITNHSRTCIDNPANFSNKVFDCQNNIIEGDDTGADYGIYLNGKSNNAIKNCIVTEFYSGIYLDSSSNNNTLANNTANSNSGHGIFLSTSSNNTLANNTANSNPRRGIYLCYSSNNTITDNTVDYNGNGIYLSTSSNNTLADNVMQNDGISIFGYSIEHWNTHTIDSSNTVNGKPVIYWKDRDSGTVPLGAGQVILANCSNIGVSGQNVSNASNGIQFGFSNNNILTNNTVNFNREGIYFYFSSNNTLINNTASSNNIYGIYLYSNSNNNILTNNTASSNNIYGIYLYSNSNNNILTNNTASSNSQHGIYFESSSNNTLTDNTANSNSQHGIYLESSSNNTLTDNTICHNQNQDIYLDSLSTGNSGDNTCGLLQDDDSNTVTCLRECFFEQGICGQRITSNKILTEDLLNCPNNGIRIRANNITLNCQSHTISGNDLGNGVDNDGVNNTIIENCIITNFIYGINYNQANNGTIKNNTATSNRDYGIYLSSSLNNSITDNTVNLNDHGIYLKSSSNNTLLNNTMDSNENINTYLLGESTDNSILSNIFLNSSTGILFEFVSSGGACVGEDGRCWSRAGADEEYCQKRIDENGDECEWVPLTGACVGLDGTCWGAAGADEDYCQNLIDEEGMECEWVPLTGACVGEDGNCWRDAGADEDYCQNLIDDGRGCAWVPFTGACVGLDGTCWGAAGADEDYCQLLIGWGLPCEWTLFEELYPENNTIVLNNVLSNLLGINITTGINNNQIYNNYFNNTNNAEDNGTNHWNTTKTLGTNIFGGDYLGGNYWSDYNGSDTDGDGLGDTNLPWQGTTSITNGGDWHPLTEVATVDDGDDNGASGGGGGSSYYYEQLKIGVVYTKTLVKKGVFRFKISNAKHVFTLQKVYENMVDVKITSTPIEANVSVGETKTFDLDEDGFEELSVTLTEITNNKAILDFELLAETEEAGEETGGAEEQPDKEKGEVYKESGLGIIEKIQMQLWWIITGIGVILIAVAVVLMVVWKKQKSGVKKRTKK